MNSETPDIPKQAIENATKSEQSEVKAAEVLAYIENIRKNVPSENQEAFTEKITELFSTENAYNPDGQEGLSRNDFDQIKDAFGENFDEDGNLKVSSLDTNQETNTNSGVLDGKSEAIISRVLQNSKEIQQRSGVSKNNTISEYQINPQLKDTLQVATEMSANLPPEAQKEFKQALNQYVQNNFKLSEIDQNGDGINTHEWNDWHEKFQTFITGLVDNPESISGHIIAKEEPIKASSEEISEAYSDETVKILTASLPEDQYEKLMATAIEMGLSETEVLAKARLVGKMNAKSESLKQGFKDSSSLNPNHDEITLRRLDEYKEQILDGKSVDEKAQDIIQRKVGESQSTVEALNQKVELSPENQKQRKNLTTFLDSFENGGGSYFTAQDLMPEIIKARTELQTGDLDSAKSTIQPIIDTLVGGLFSEHATSRDLLNDLYHLNFSDETMLNGEKITADMIAQNPEALMQAVREADDYHGASQVAAEAANSDDEVLESDQKAMETSVKNYVESKIEAQMEQAQTLIEKYLENLAQTDPVKYHEQEIQFQDENLYSEAVFQVAAQSLAIQGFKKFSENNPDNNALTKIEQDMNGGGWFDLNVSDSNADIMASIVSTSLVGGLSGVGKSIPKTFKTIIKNVPKPSLKPLKNIKIKSLKPKKPAPALAQKAKPKFNPQNTAKEADGFISNLKDPRINVSQRSNLTAKINQRITALKTNRNTGMANKLAKQVAEIKSVRAQLPKGKKVQIPANTPGKTVTAKVQKIDLKKGTVQVAHPRGPGRTVLKDLKIDEVRALNPAKPKPVAKKPVSVAKPKSLKAQAVEKGQQGLAKVKAWKDAIKQLPKEHSQVLGNFLAKIKDPGDVIKTFKGLPPQQQRNIGTALAASVAIFPASKALQELSGFINPISSAEASEEISDTNYQSIPDGFKKYADSKTSTPEDAEVKDSPEDAAEKLKKQEEAISKLFEKTAQSYKPGDWKKITDELAKITGKDTPKTEALKIALGKKFQKEIAKKLGLKKIPKSLSDGKIGPETMKKWKESLLVVGASKIESAKEDLVKLSANPKWKENNKAVGKILGVDLSDASTEELIVFGKSVQRYAGGTDGKIGKNTISRMKSKLES